MAGRIEAKLGEMGITLPEPARPVAAYVPFVRAGSLLFVSGQLPVGMDPIPTHTLSSADHADGAPSPDSPLALAKAAARMCAINLLAHAKAGAGGLDDVSRVVKLVGFVKSDSRFAQAPLVVNGASELMVEAFGPAGEHARSAIGVSSLPFGAVVEVEAVFEIG